MEANFASHFSLSCLSFPKVFVHFIQPLFIPLPHQHCATFLLSYTLTHIKLNMLYEQKAQTYMCCHIREMHIYSCETEHTQ